MKVIKKGNGQKGWSKSCICTGKGNRDGGCGAVLLVEEDDLYTTANYCGIDDSTDYYNTFKCCECGVETDISGAKIPGRILDAMRKKYDARKQRRSNGEK